MPKTIRDTLRHLFKPTDNVAYRPTFKGLSYCNCYSCFSSMMMRMRAHFDGSQLLRYDCDLAFLEAAQEAEK
jgi:hypothetical protein